MKSIFLNIFKVLVVSVSLIATNVSANDGSAFVEQVDSGKQQPLSAERQVATFSTPGDGAINNIDVENINRDDLLSPPGINRNVSVVIQRGERNRATVDTQGGRNATFQFQQGTELASQVNIFGTRNAIITDQKGNSLKSDIYVVGGNKSILHVQRGTGTSPSHTPLVYSGAEREFELILDTPRGRLTKAIPQ